MFGKWQHGNNRLIFLLQGTTYCGKLRYFLLLYRCRQGSRVSKQLLRFASPACQACRQPSPQQGSLNHCATQSPSPLCTPPKILFACVVLTSLLMHCPHVSLFCPTKPHPKVERKTSTSVMLPLRIRAS